MSQDLFERVLRSPRLPSLPTIALEVIDLVQRKDVNIKQIAHTISHDPALTSKILKTVNSAFYGQAHSISTISHALVVLGLNSVKTLALGFSLVGNLKDSAGEGLDHVTFWKRSLYTAGAARALAAAVGLPQQEETFLGGLLQDLGILAMSQTISKEYKPLLAEAGKDYHRLLELERAKLGADHASIGARLAESWNLPPLLVVPIKFHEAPDRAPEDLRPIVRCIALGNHVADVFLGVDPGHALESYYRQAQAWFDLPRERAEPILSTIHGSTQEMRKLFDLPDDSIDYPDDILARANEALQNISLQAAQQTTQLEQEKKQLVEQVLTDGLTGVANRRSFNQCIAEQFGKTKSGEGPLSLLFLDTDHFKKFNDTYGHQVGDKVLMDKAALLRKLTPQGGLVARYGGEEFAIVLPGSDRPAAALLAESIRKAIEAMEVTTDDGERLHVTASIGVATYDGGFYETPEQLISAADQAVYAAKKSGRNCVRVFLPKPRVAA